jgi:hypothetical protein
MQVVAEAKVFLVMVLAVQVAVQQVQKLLLLQIVGLLILEVAEEVIVEDQQVQAAKAL